MLPNLYDLKVCGTYVLFPFIFGFIISLMPLAGRVFLFTIFLFLIFAIDDEHKDSGNANKSPYKLYLLSWFIGLIGTVLGASLFFG